MASGRESDPEISKETGGATGQGECKASAWLVNVLSEIGPKIDQIGDVPLSRQSLSKLYEQVFMPHLRCFLVGKGFGDISLDVAQDVALTILRLDETSTFTNGLSTPGEFPGFSRRFMLWLFRTAVNRALDRRRWERNARKHGAHFIIKNPKKAKGPLGELCRSEFYAVFTNALDQLSDEHRQILVLRDMDDNPLSYKDIGEMLNISENAVKSRLFRARSALLEKLPSFEELISYLEVIA